LPEPSAPEVEDFTVRDDAYAGDAAAFGFGNLDVDNDLTLEVVGMRGDELGVGLDFGRGWRDLSSS